MRKAVIPIILLLLVANTFALSATNPVYICPPRRLLLVSAEYSYTTVPFSGQAGRAIFWSQRLGIHFSHTWFKILELGLIVGGADLNLRVPGATEINGSWELMAGAKARLQYSQRLRTRRTRFFATINARFALIRTRGNTFINSTKYSVYYSWREYCLDGVGAIRYKNVAFAGGIRLIYVDALGTWKPQTPTAYRRYSGHFTSRTVVKPILGFNWEIKDNYVFDVEIYPIPWRKNESGFTIGFSNYR